MQLPIALWSSYTSITSHLPLAQVCHGTLSLMIGYSRCILVGSIPWFYVSEIFEQSTRGKANMIAATTNRMSAFIVGCTFLPLKVWTPLSPTQNDNVTISHHFQNAMNEYVFLLYGGIAAFCFVFIYLAAPETKGRQVHEVAKELQARTPRCCR